MASKKHPKPRNDPEQRAAKRARQRAAGYRGIKKGQGSQVDRHGSGKMSRDGRKGEIRRKHDH